MRFQPPRKKSSIQRAQLHIEAARQLAVISVPLRNEGGVEPGAGGVTSMRELDVVRIAFNVRNSSSRQQGAEVVGLKVWREIDLRRSKGEAAQVRSGRW